MNTWKKQYCEECKAERLHYRVYEGYECMHNKIGRAENVGKKEGVVSDEGSVHGVSRNL